MPEEQQTAVQSQMRAVYTACSRARDVLYVISDLKPGTPMEEIIKQAPDRTPLPQSSTQSGTPSTDVRTGNKRNTVTKRTASATIKERLLNEVVDHVTIKAVIQETKKDATVMVDLAKSDKNYNLKADIIHYYETTIKPEMQISQDEFLELCKEVGIK